jgi:LPS-assembly protein
LKKLDFICLTALPLLLGMAEPVFAQDDPALPAGEAREVDFSATSLSYDSDSEIVTATGDVRMVSEGNNLRADTVIWNRATGEVKAEGNVRVVNPGGDTAYGDSIVLTDSLRDGMIENLLLVLEDGGRLAAVRAERKDGYTTLYRAAYSPCAVVNEDGCPKSPTWQITAVKVVHDPVRNRIRYEGASLNLLGARIIALPWLSHPDGTGGGGTGLLVPELRVSQNGIELSAP